MTEIVIIDDDEGDIRALRAELKSRLQPTTYRAILGGDAALLMLRVSERQKEPSPDAIIFEPRLADKNAEEVLRFIKSTNVFSKCQIFVYSAERPASVAFELFEYLKKGNKSDVSAAADRIHEFMKKKYSA